MTMPPSDGAAGTIVAGTPTQLGTFTMKVPTTLASRQFSLTIQP